MTIPNEINRIEVVEYIGDDGDLMYSIAPSEGMTFPDVVKLLEMAKLSMNDLYRNGEWEDL